MSATPISSILSLPTELLTLVSSYLGKSVVPFRRVCRTFQDVSPVAFEAYTNKFFIDRYGARAECEKDIPYYIVAQRIESAEVINKVLFIDSLELEVLTVEKKKPKLERHLAEFRDLWLEIDSSEVPRLIRFEKTNPEALSLLGRQSVSLLIATPWYGGSEDQKNSMRCLQNAIKWERETTNFFKKEASFLERMKTKYRFYRREFHRERDEKVNKLIRLQNHIATELYNEPFNFLYPLQDLRNRCLRLQTLETEREGLSRAMKASRGSYNEFLSKLRLIERVFFFVISWFHSWFQKPYTIELEISELPESFKSLNERGVKFGETKITFQGQEIPVEIKARFGSYDEKTFSKRTVFMVCRADDQSPLGYFAVEKAWTHIKRDGFDDQRYSEIGGNAGKNVETLESPKLYIQYFENEQLRQDSTNGDRPIMRLLTQIAVEIFQLEAVNTLEIGSNYCDADVYFAGGFSSLYSKKRDARIKHDIQTARAENKLFPAIANRDLAAFDVYIGKSSTNTLSKVVTCNEKDQEQPAMVDFDFDHPPITWEDQIKANRLLPEKGPILPRFFYQDLSRFEKPPQRP